MNLYRSLGRIWTGTQADAKEAQGGKDFERIEVPTDKPGLIAFLNDMEARVGKGMAAPEPAQDMADQEPYATFQRDLVAAEAHYEFDGARNDTPMGVPIPMVGNFPPTDPSDCPACSRSKRVAKIAVNSSAAINIYADLEDVHDATSLRKIIDLAQEKLDLAMSEAA